MTRATMAWATGLALTVGAGEAAAAPSPLETPEPGDDFGHAVALGDFDGDGIVDLAAGAPGESYGSLIERAGVVLVFRGFHSGEMFEDEDGDTHPRVDFTPWRTLRRHDLGTIGMKEDDRLGSALAVGDFDGDGFDDLAIGCPGANSPIGNMTGRVYLAWGSDDGLESFTDISLSTTGMLPTGEDGFGSALAVGDFDGDGHDDLAIGAPQSTHGDDQYAGEVRLMRGSDAGLVAWTGVNQEVTQTAVTPAGTGSGMPLGIHQTYDGFGAALAVGDLDDDGRDDLVVGAPVDSEGGPYSGSVYVFQSAPEGMRGWDRLDQAGLDPDEFGDGFGSAVAIGNLKSGSPYLNEIIVGAPFEDLESVDKDNVGQIFTFENQGGVITGITKSLQTGVSDNEAGDQFGASFVVFQMLGTHYDSLWVGAPGDDHDGLTDAGELLLFVPSGAGPIDAGQLGTGYAMLHGDAPRQRFGQAVAVGGTGNTFVYGHRLDPDRTGAVRYDVNGGHADLLQDSVHVPKRRSGYESWTGG